MLRITKGLRITLLLQPVFNLVEPLTAVAVAVVIV